jgi:hypothetical protein
MFANIRQPILNGEVVNQSGVHPSAATELFFRFM